MGNISQIKIGNTIYDIKDKNIKLMGASGSSHSGGLVPDTPSTSGTSKYLREDGTWTTPPDTWRPLGTGADDACAGNDSRLSNARPASDVSDWAKAANKPSYNYSEIGYTVLTTSSAGGAITVDATKPLHEITITAAVSSITFTSNSLPENGHSCHLIIIAASALSVTIAHNATMATVDSVAYKSVCPEASDVSLDIVAGGYIELDLLRIGTKIYVRGI